jgi:hypothetical protein
MPKALPRWARSMRLRLVQADSLANSDLIFVLAGHRNRKVFGVRLLRDGWASRILLSTGDPPYIARVLEQELQASAWPNRQDWSHIHDVANRPSPSAGQFFAFLDNTGWSVQQIPIQGLGTLSEIKALAAWLQQRPAIRSLLIVSAATHLKRAGMCCRRLLPASCRVRLIAVPPQIADGSPLTGRAPREDSRTILLEWGKVILYRVVLAFCSRARDH